MINFSLRETAPTDIPTLTHLFASVFSGPPFNYPWVTDETAARYIRDLCAAPGALSFFLRRGSEPLGFCVGAVADYFLAPQYEIKEFAVLHAEQHAGAGTRMLDMVEAELRRRGVTDVFLQTSRTLAAFGFYRKRGYDVVEENAYLIKMLR